ncbi:hypothetical protein KSP40_PGU012819 [Platanthera guangdongensis]|uniref:Ribosomal protein S10 n=1 Tax=Platanthera guangdongensis TaxID=2320717 RepID=A0ABR2M399_9ASPA
MRSSPRSLRKTHTIIPAIFPRAPTPTAILQRRALTPTVILSPCAYCRNPPCARVCVILCAHFNDTVPFARGAQFVCALIDILYPTAQTIDSLMQLDLPAGVDVEVKL